MMAAQIPKILRSPKSPGGKLWSIKRYKILFERLKKEKPARFKNMSFKKFVEISKKAESNLRFKRISGSSGDALKDYNKAAMKRSGLATVPKAGASIRPKVKKSSLLEKYGDTTEVIKRERERYRKSKEQHSIKDYERTTKKQRGP